MKRVIAAVIVVSILIGFGAWFGVAALTDNDDGYSRIVPRATPTEPAVPTSCNHEVLCSLRWSWSLEESKRSFELMAKACGLPTTPNAPVYFHLCQD